MQQPRDSKHSAFQKLSDDAQTELFPFEWLITEPILTVINTSPTGIALLQTIRNNDGQIIDFQYRMANPIQYALTNHPEEDLLNLPLTKLSPDIVETGMLERLIQVAVTGVPNRYVEEYHLDGSVGHYDQVYVQSGDGVLMLVQDVTYRPLSAGERQQQMALLEAIYRKDPRAAIRARLVDLIKGHTP